MLVVACPLQAFGRPLACEAVNVAGQGWLWACLSSHLPQQPSAECHRWATSARGSGSQGGRGPGAQLPGASWSRAPTGNLRKWRCRCREQGRVVQVRLAATGPPPHTACRGGPCRWAEGGGVTTSGSCFCAWREGGGCDRCTAQQDTGSPWEAQRAASWTISFLDNQSGHWQEFPRPVLGALGRRRKHTAHPPDPRCSGCQQLGKRPEVLFMGDPKASHRGGGTRLGAGSGPMEPGALKRQKFSGLGIAELKWAVAGEETEATGAGARRRVPRAGRARERHSPGPCSAGRSQSDRGQDSGWEVRTEHSGTGPRQRRPDSTQDTVTHSQGGQQARGRFL